MFTISKNLLLQWLYAFMEFLVFFPIILLVGILAIPTKLTFLWCFSLLLLIFIGICISNWFTKQKRWVHWLLILFVNTLLAITYLDGVLSLTITIFVGSFFAFRGVKFGEQPVDQGISYSVLWVSFPVYFVSYFFYRFIDLLYPYLETVSFIGIATLVLTLFLSNSEHLKIATLSHEKKPFLSKSLKLHNRIYILFTIVLIFLITNIKLIEQLLGQVFRSIFNFIKWVLGILTSNESVEEVKKMPQQIPSMGEPGEPSAFFALLQKIFMVGFYVLLIIAGISLAVYVLFKVWKLIRRAFRWIYSYLNNLVDTKDRREEDGLYIDETENMFDWKEILQNYQEKIKDHITGIHLRQEKWQDLESNKEKIRFIYRMLLLKKIKSGYKFDPHLTPKEILHDLNTSSREDIDLLIETYSKARYSNNEVVESKVKQLRTLIK